MGSGIARQDAKDASVNDPRASILELCAVSQGSSAHATYQHSLALAQAAERWGYRRFWLAEHHGMPGIASAAPTVLMAHIAAGTHSIRVGSGGIMLPNHPPLVVAEQLATLASLYPGRIDAGIGRAPGSDVLTTVALQRDPQTGADDFPEQLSEVMAYLQPRSPGSRLPSVPGAGADLPLWLLGSSPFSAHLAAARGLPYAFASHFAPAGVHECLAVYRREFRPSRACPAPHVMIGVTTLCAPTDEEAHFLFSSHQRAMLNLVRGRAGLLLGPPESSMLAQATPEERAAVARLLSFAVVGSPATVAAGLRDRLATTGADELILAGHCFDPRLRLRSFALIAQALWGAPVSATDAA